MKNGNEDKVSRRRFLEAAVVVTATAGAAQAEAPTPDPERERLERIVAKYGSEIGDLRKVR